MAFQSGKNMVIAVKPEVTFNTAPGTGSAVQMRFNPSPGLSLKKALIRSGEVRSDGLSSMARHGSQSVEGSFTSELANGAFDTILEALMRSTWVAATVITEATAALASITTTTSTIVASAGSWITAGVRAGDVFRLTNHSTAGNNSINLRVKSVTASTITLHGTPLILNATPDTTFTVTIFKKLKNGATPTKRTFYVEEYFQDADVSQVAGGCKWISMKITGQPDGMATVEFGLLGASLSPLASGASPYFVSPTLNTAIALVFADATLSYNGSDVAVATAFELNYVITAKTEPVIGSTTTPDVFDNDANLTGSLTLIRQDLANLTLYKNETEFALHVLLVEPESEPKDAISLFVPRVKLTDVSAAKGNDGAMMETLPFTCGKSESVTGVDDSLLTISSSAA